jgi:hypothetical protein
LTEDLRGSPGQEPEGKVEMDDDLTMLIVPARNRTPLEISILDLGGEDPVTIHAMHLRPKFFRFIRQERSHETH